MATDTPTRVLAPTGGSFLIENRTPDEIFTVEDLTEEQRNRMVFANIPPTLSLVLTVDMAIYLIVRATGPETLEMDTGVLVAPGAMRNPTPPAPMKSVTHANFSPSFSAPPPSL